LHLLGTAGNGASVSRILHIRPAFYVSSPLSAAQYLQTCIAQ
jgi:hypothetical protein